MVGATRGWYSSKSENNHFVESQRVGTRFQNRACGAIVICTILSSQFHFPPRSEYISRMQHHRRSKLTFCGYFPPLDAIYAPETSLNTSDALPIAQANGPRTSGVPRTPPSQKHVDTYTQRHTLQRSLSLPTILRNHFEDDATGGKFISLHCGFRKVETLPFDMISFERRTILAYPSYIQRSDISITTGSDPITGYSMKLEIGPDFGRAHGTGTIEYYDEDMSIGFLDIVRNVPCHQEQSKKPQSKPINTVGNFQSSRKVIASAKAKKSGGNGLICFCPMY